MTRRSSNYWNYKDSTREQLRINNFQKELKNLEKEIHKSQRKSIRKKHQNR